VTHATRMVLVRHCEYKSNRLTTVFITFTGSKTLKFFTLAEFHLWREREEEATYTTYDKANRSTIYVHGTGIRKIPNTTAVQLQKCFTCRHPVSLLVLVLLKWQVPRKYGQTHRVETSLAEYHVLDTSTIHTFYLCCIIFFLDKSMSFCWLQND